MNVADRSVQSKPVPNMSLDSNGQGGLANIGEGLCKDCTILSGRYLLNVTTLDKTTKKYTQLPASTVYIHHFTSSNIGRRVPNPIQGCLGSTNSGDFIDAGQDSGTTDTIFTTQDGTFNSGFHMKNPDLRVNYDLVNQDARTLHVFVKLEIEYIPTIEGKDAGHSLKSVRPYTSRFFGLSMN
jgi:hypothetical protein